MRSSSADISRFTLIEAGDAHRTHHEWLTWRRWFEVNDMPVTVAVDAGGSSVHQTGPREWQQKIRSIPVATV